MAKSANVETSLDGTLVSQLEFNSPADPLYEIYWRKRSRFSTIMPQQILSVQVIEGPEYQLGSECLWTFADGTCGSWTDKVTAIHDSTNSITWTLLDGRVPKKSFRNLKVVHQFSPRGQGCTAKVTLTYEKNDTSVADPVDYMDFLCHMVKEAAKAATEAAEKAAANVAAAVAVAAAEAAQPSP